jgi:hypothetical protein
MLTGKSILTQILDENIIDAKKSICTLLAQKAKVYLEDKRRCIASITYGPCSEANGQGDCSCEEQVEKDCGCDEKVDEDCDCNEEELTDKQKKLDKNHNGVLDKQDFMIVRGKKKKKED